MKDTCPHCGENQVDGEIPEEIRSYYGGDHAYRTIGVEIPGAYDGVLFWQCPDCGGRWHRFEPGDFRFGRAVPYVDAEGAKAR